MRKTALVTGATNGIGYELARQFAQEKYDLVIVARHRSDLESVASTLEQEWNIRVTVLPSDLSEHGAPTKIAAELKKKKMNVDILVNNAGFGLFGSFSETDVEKELNMIHLNIISLTHLTKLLLPGMLKRKSGRILNVASTASFMPGPFSAVYFATKAYVLSFSEALSNELSGTGVEASALCPGATKTGFESRSEGAGTGLFKANPHLMTAEQVAKAAFKGLMKGKRIIIPGWRNAVQIFLLRFAPRSLVTKIVRSVVGK